jgi:hypothetical protein
MGGGTCITPRGGVLLTVIAVAILLAAAPAHPGDLMGTWRGTLSMDGQAIEFTATFSENDYFLFTYENSFGMVRTVELSGPGQIQFAPPGGGLMTMVVESVRRRPDGVAYVLRTSFERASNGAVVERQNIIEEADYSFTAEGLKVRIVRRPVAFLGDKSGSTGGSPNARIVEGVLKKR